MPSSMHAGAEFCVRACVQVKGNRQPGGAGTCSCCKSWPPLQRQMRSATCTVLQSSLRVCLARPVLLVCTVVASVLEFRRFNIRTVHLLRGGCNGMGFRTRVSRESGGGAKVGFYWHAARTNLCSAYKWQPSGACHGCNGREPVRPWALSRVSTRVTCPPLNDHDHDNGTGRSADSTAQTPIGDDCSLRHASSAEAVCWEEPS
ncbi:hypothetical protein B0T24DRAFT_420915 [Lasiosphaeria ovina]|uniref:Uncharacterized protein n=1 Tax=Lasiosphaeria ovina TaxID=92902 RepID=A0AAE0JWD7_9PEZI|nr:hypothetical protein B0T24DRAFT_420915 [Lasiosphaeria ovina]